MSKIKGKTKTGFEFVVDKNVLDDFEFLEMFDDVGTTGIGSTHLYKKILGEEQYERLKKFCRRKDGFLSATRIEYEMKDIMLGNHEVKN